jgi:lipooligosaccharide transport system ATP-binding protein
MPQDALTIKAQLGVVSQMDTLDPDFTCLKTCWCTAAISA